MSKKPLLTLSLDFHSQNPSFQETQQQIMKRKYVLLYTQARGS